ncbi:hypothetical protein THIX_60697 [Thiomonas sp. X19]|nr:hypothetical protein THIX_60697 [Thiomonas sp. X19]
MAQVAGAHHEKLDGTGYPRGLSAGLISMETRIITTADIFDAISVGRPYRAAVPVDQILAMMGPGCALHARLAAGRGGVHSCARTWGRAQWPGVCRCLNR